MSFINWGHETPEQKEIRRKMEERMLFEQMSYSAAMAAAAAAGSGGLAKNYALTGRSSMSSFIEDGEYKYYTYNYDTDMLTDIRATNIPSTYSDTIYVLQDKGFILRYSSNNIRKYIFTDINGDVIKKLTIDTTQYVVTGRYVKNGVMFYVYAISETTGLELHIFNGSTVKKYTISDIYLYPFGGGADYSVHPMKNGETFISWRSADSTKYYLGTMINGSVSIVDSIITGEETWNITNDWNADFITVTKADYTTGEYKSFKVFDSTGAVIKSLNLTSYQHDNFRRDSFYGNNKYFFILSGSSDDSNLICSYDYNTNEIIQQTAAGANLLDINVYYHYWDSDYPNGMSDYNDDGILGVTLSNDLMVTYSNEIDSWYDNNIWWYRVDTLNTYVLFDGTSSFSEDTTLAYAFDTFHFDYERVIRSFSEDQTIIFDGFTWDEGVGRGSENYQRVIFKPNASRTVVNAAISINTSKLVDGFFLSSARLYCFYDNSNNTYFWIKVDSDGQSNSVSQNLGSSTQYYRTHDTLAIVDFSSERTYIVNKNSNYDILDLNTETGVWYNKVFVSHKNGYGDISPTIEFAYYPNNTGWGSIVIVHDTGVDDADYGKTISILREDYFEYTLPMIYSNDWKGELGRDTLLFAWQNNIGGWSANLYDLKGNILSGTNISADANVTGEVDVWNLTDRAIISIVPDTNVNASDHYYFGQSSVSVVNVGPSDYWWENDFPAWYSYY